MFKAIKILEQVASFDHFAAPLQIARGK